MFLALVLVFVTLVTGCVHTYVNSGEGNEAGPDVEKTIDTKIHSQIESEITGINTGDRATKKRIDQK